MIWVSPTYLGQAGATTASGVTLAGFAAPFPLVMGMMAGQTGAPPAGQSFYVAMYTHRRR